MSTGREILKEQFGKPIKITQLVIKQLMEEEVTPDLQAYADQLESAYVSLRDVRAEAELDAQGILVTGQKVTTGPKEKMANESIRH